MEVTINNRFIKKIKRKILSIFNFTYFEYLIQFIKFKTKLKNSNNEFNVKWKDRKPILNDRTKETKFDRHYIYHPAWAARVLAETKPSIHVDISSSLHFCSIISSFINVEFFDYRPAKIELDNLSTKYADILNLPFSDKSIESLSCMHVVEHIGLGRYGDSLNPDGDLTAISELKRIIKPNGNLIFVVPIGKPRICFNAHRIYDPVSILRYFDSLTLIEFAVVTDGGQFIRRALPDEYTDQKYACGCYFFRKTEE